jgi:hypothetical protein
MSGILSSEVWVDSTWKGYFGTVIESSNDDPIYDGFNIGIAILRSVFYLFASILLDIFRLLRRFHYGFKNSILLLGPVQYCHKTKPIALILDGGYQELDLYTLLRKSI